MKVTDKMRIDWMQKYLFKLDHITDMDSKIWWAWRSRWEHPSNNKLVRKVIGGKTLRQHLSVAVRTTMKAVYYKKKKVKR